MSLETGQPSKTSIAKRILQKEIISLELEYWRYSGRHRDIYRKESYL